MRFRISRSLSYVAVIAMGVLLPALAPMRPAVLGGHLGFVEVADSPAERSRGLQFRERLPSGRGMLFVFEQDTIPSFWMKDTPLPLSIAFLDSRKHIVSLHDMQPLRTDLRYSPPVPVRYALEMPQGWFHKRGIKVGDRAWFW